MINLLNINFLIILNGEIIRKCWFQVNWRNKGLIRLINWW